MSTKAELFTIGQLARRTGVPARTVRFWSDAGLIPPAGRSAGGYRLFDSEAAARLDLVRTLRELGLGLDVVAAVLSRAQHPRRGCGHARERAGRADPGAAAAPGGAQHGRQTRKHG